MSIFTSLNEKLKDTSVALSALSAIVITIGGAVLYVENNYAHAQDVKSLLRNQSSQIQLYQQSQTQNQLFQLEYYDNTIKKLEIERIRSEELLADPSITRGVRAYTRKPSDIQDEINELKARKEVVRKSITEAK